MARPSLEVNDRDRKVVKTMAALGCRHEDIARVLDVTPKTLRKHFREELDRAAIEANAKVLQSLFKMATSGKNTAASIFWAKTRCGMSERPAPREALASEEGPPSFVLKVE